MLTNIDPRRDGCEDHSGVIHGSFVIGKAEADTNGKAVIGVTPANGLPTSGTILKVRQTCSNNVLESDLPPVVPSGVPGLVDKLDAPKVVGGFYECSRSLTVTNIYRSEYIFGKGRHVGVALAFRRFA